LTTIGGLDGNPQLETLLLSRNRIGENGPADYAYLASLKKLS
jgi:hypothetical protein